MDPPVSHHRTTVGGTRPGATSTGAGGIPTTAFDLALAAVDRAVGHTIDRLDVVRAGPPETTIVITNVDSRTDPATYARDVVRLKHRPDGVIVVQSVARVSVGDRDEPAVADIGEIDTT